MSTKSKIFNFMLRNRHILQGKLRKPVFDMNTSIEDFRELCEKGANRLILMDCLQKSLCCKKRPAKPVHLAIIRGFTKPATTVY